MTWFLLALVAPLLYACTNYIDKILLEKYFKASGVGTLILFSSLLSVIALPILYFADTSVLSVSPFNIFILCTVGLLDIAILWLYLMALDGDEPTIIIVFYQLVPVFALGLGYILLGEVLTQIQLISMGIIILGTTLVAFEFDDGNNFKIRKRTVILMTLAALAWAAESVLFKVVALEEHVFRSLFWEHLMLVIVGIVLFTFVSSYRKNFIDAVRQNSRGIFSLNILNESLYMFGNAVVAFVVMMAPVALVLLGNSFQNIFVLIIGAIITIFFPKLFSEKIDKHHLLQKLAAILLTGIGTYLLLS
jgi:drug/metabolite transporter (DMT)-like permease